MIDPETKRKGLEKLAKFGLIAIAAAITSSVAWYAAVGLIGWGVALGSWLLISNFAPVFAEWVANKRIQALVAVIEANPIETMQNLFIDKGEELSSAEGNIRDFETELGNFRDQVKEVKAQYPEEAETYVEIEGRMSEALSAMKQGHTAAVGELRKFGEKIKKAQVLFNMAKAANKMLEKSQTAQQEYFAVLKEQVSYNKVRSDLNKAFANLNTAVDRRKNAALFAVPTQAAIAAAPAVEIIDLGRVREGTLIGKRN